MTIEDCNAYLSMLTATDERPTPHIPMEEADGAAQDTGRRSDRRSGGGAARGPRRAAIANDPSVRMGEFQHDE